MSSGVATAVTRWALYPVPPLLSPPRTTCRPIHRPSTSTAAPSCSAAMAILRQQAAFVDELFSSGIIDDAERRAMQVVEG